MKLTDNKQVIEEIRETVEPVEASNDSVYDFIRFRGIQWAELKEAEAADILVEDLVNFQEKLDYLDQYAEPVTPKEFYREMFPEGSFERQGHPEDNRPNGMIMAKVKSGKMTTLRVYDELEEIDKIQEAEFAVMAPVSYIGKKRKSMNARYLHALAFDIDDVKLDHLQTMFHQFEIGLLPKPTFIVNSGKGVHLYYVFDEPIALYQQVQTVLKDIKYALTNVLWTRYTSGDEETQYQGIFQPFRLPGTVTKFKNTITLEAYRVGEKTTLYELMAHLRYQSETINIYAIEPLIQREEKQDKQLTLFNTTDTRIKFDDKENKIKRIKAEYDISDLKYRSKLTLKEAKAKYPEWYQRFIVDGETKKKAWDIAGQKGHKGDEMYQWWKRKMANEAVSGARYNAIMCLAIYAKKCNVDRETLVNDALAFLGPLNKLKGDQDREPLTEDEVLKALSTYDDAYLRYPIKDIERRTKIKIERNKRNGRKQEEHIKRITLLRDNDYPDGSWREGNGRKSKLIEVATYVSMNPGLTPTQYARALGVSRPTIYKYMKK